MEEKGEQDSKLEKKVEENQEGKGEEHQEAEGEVQQEANGEEDDSAAKNDYSFWRKNITGANRAPENPMLEHAFKLGKNFEANFTESFEKHQEKIMSKVTPQVEKITTILNEQNPIPNLVQHFLNYALPRGPKVEMPTTFGQAWKPQPSKPVESTDNKPTATEEAPKKPSDQVAKNAV